MLKTKNLKKLKYRLVWLHSPGCHYSWSHISIRKYFPKTKKYKKMSMFDFMNHKRNYEKKFLILIKEVKWPLGTQEVLQL